MKMFSSPMIGLVRAHHANVAELQAQSSSKLILAGDWRRVLTGRLEAVRHPVIDGSTCKMSRAARAALDAADLPQSWVNCRRLGLRYEHSTPLKVLYWLAASAIEAGADDAEIATILEAHLVPVWVTLEEDKQLNQSRLKSQMPTAWKAGDVFARYTAVGIELDA